MVMATPLPSGPTIQREGRGEGRRRRQDGHTGDGTGEGGAKLVGVGYVDDVGPWW
jgi:hypothetical protein